MATVRPFQVNNGLEVSLNANVGTTVTASDFIQSSAINPIAPRFVFDFVKTEQLDSRITFTRSSNATYTTANGLLATATSNQPRFQYENGVGVGLYIETQRSNLYKYSNDIYSAVNGARSAGSYIFFDSSIGFRHSGLGTVANQDYMMSLYIKVNSCTNQAYTLSIGDGPSAYINFSTFTVGQWTRVTQLTRQGVSGDIFDLRLSPNKLPVTINQAWFDSANASFITQNYGLAPNGLRESTRISYTCTDSTFFDIEVWGAQCEAGSYLTSFIPTRESSATRSTDVCYVGTPAGNTLGISPDRGTFVVTGKSYKPYSANTPSFDNGSTLLTMTYDDGLQTNYLSLQRDELTSSLYAGSTTTIGGFRGTSVTVSGNTATTNTELRGAFAYNYASNTYIAALNGTVATYTQGLIVFPSTNLLYIGHNYFLGNRVINGPIKKVAYYTRPLSNNELIAITA